MRSTLCADDIIGGRKNVAQKQIIEQTSKKAFY